MHRLTGDMYYEIASRALPPDPGFRRRTYGSSRDPVNAMLSLGYSLLYGNVCVSAIGAKLDTDLGFLGEGRGSLVQDLMDPFRASMVDALVFSCAGALSDGDYETGPDRCILSDPAVAELIRRFRQSIDTAKIDALVRDFRESVMNSSEFRVPY